MKAQPAKENPSEKTEQLCGGVSCLDEPCNASATWFCEECKRWFCASHSHDDLWHSCALAPGDEGGEG